jgi:hypothetical protein
MPLVPALHGPETSKRDVRTLHRVESTSFGLHCASLGASFLSQPIFLCMWKAFHVAWSETGRFAGLSAFVIITHPDCRGEMHQDQSCFQNGISASRPANQKRVNPTAPRLYLTPPIVPSPKNNHCWPNWQDSAHLVSSPLSTRNRVENPSSEKDSDDEDVESVPDYGRGFVARRLISQTDVSRGGAFSPFKTRPPP